MREVKRIIALVLALTFIFCFMAVNAAAVEPRGRACDSCGASNTTTTSSVATGNNLQYTVSGCSTVSGYHLHVDKEYGTRFKCYNCGYTYYYNTYKITQCLG